MLTKTTQDAGVARLADIEALERIPLENRDLPSSTYEMLRRGTSVAPDALALSFFLRTPDFRKPVTWTHAELMREITRAANAFRRLGVGRTDVVAFVLPNLPETHFVIWGAETAGIAFAINPLLDEAQIAELLRAGGAKLLVTLGPTPGSDIWEKATEAARRVPGLEGVLRVSIAPYLSGAAALAVRGLGLVRRASAGAAKILDLRREMAKENADRLEFASPAPQDVSSYFCTGGTTGLPKIAKRTHASEVFDSWAMQCFVEGAFAAGSAVFCGLPLFHVNGQLVTGLAPWSKGAHVVMGTPQGYRGDGLIKSFWDIAEHYRIVAFSGVPTVYSALLQHPVGGRDIASIKYGLCGAAPMPEELFRVFQTTTGIRILEAYGLTEGACVSSVNPPMAAPRIGSIGIRLPYQQMRVAILDGDERFERFAGTDEAGAVLISGPNVFAGYVSEAHNQSIWVQAQGRRWLNTGDLARQDAEGYFWLTGRKKELIIRGGHNIDPKTIEEPLHRHPAVALAAAVGRPDAHSGEVPVAYVQLKPGVSASPEELLTFVARQIGERAAHPKAVRVLDQLPATAVGKIFKPALIMREIEDVVREAAASAGTDVRVEVAQDSKRGLVAHVSADGEVDGLRSRLGRFAFATEFH